MVAGTTGSVALALANDRRLTPAFVEAAPQSMPAAAPSMGAAAGTITTARDYLARRTAIAALLGVAVLALAASIPALTAWAASFRTASAPAQAGPPTELRAAAGVSGNWEQSYSVAAPPAGQVGAALMAATEEQHAWDVLKAMRIIADERNSAVSAASVSSAVDAPHSLNAASGLAVGTVIRARITIYGCQGPGGGFCNHMASGRSAFEGAAACSSNLAFGTRLKIAGDPTGRVYECLDRGSLAPTWIDVYFNDTSDGMAWQGQLGGTVADIEIVN